MTPRARKFIDRVNELLKQRSNNPVQIHSGSIASDRAGTLWVLGVTMPDARVTTVDSRVMERDAYSEQTAIDVARRLNVWVEEMNMKNKQEVNLLSEQLTSAQENVAHAATVLMPHMRKLNATQYVVEAAEWEEFKDAYDAWHNAGADLHKALRG